MTSLYALIVRSADQGLILQDKKGSFPGGHNGPWYDKDTYVRTTAHWALIMHKSFEITGDEKYLESAKKACDYLISKDLRPCNYTFYCRESVTDKNLCNGLIGQAWAIEPLIKIGCELNEQKYLDTVNAVLNILPYDFYNHSWSAVEVDGRVLGEHKTLNQQIWLTSMVVVLGANLNDDYMINIGKDFYSNLKSKITFLENGLISHIFSKEVPALKKRIRKAFARNRENDEAYKKILSQSYQTFLLYGIALSIDCSAGEEIWHSLKLSDKISKAVNYVESKYPFGYLENSNSYRWSYNPVGIEMAYIYQVLNKYLNIYRDKESNEEIILKWLKKQFESYYDFYANMMSKNTSDPVILSARLYEATRLNNYQL